MKPVAITFVFSLFIASVFGQAPRFDLEKQDLNNKTLVLLNLETYIPQADSLLIAKRWLGNGIIFKQSEKLTQADWKDEQSVFVTLTPVTPQKSFFGLVQGGPKAEQFIQRDTLQYADLSQFIQYLLIDSDKCNVGLESTFVLALCDLVIQGTSGKNIEEMNARIMHKEWLMGYDRAIVDKDDISKIYYYPSELSKINVNTLSFADSASFKAPAKSRLGEIAYADRQVFEYKGKGYIINYIYTIGQGLEFFNIEPRNTQKSSPFYSRSYLQFLFQPAPMKPAVPYEEQNRQFKVPNRQ